MAAKQDMCDISHVIVAIRDGSATSAREKAILSVEYAEKLILDKKWNNAQELINYMKERIKLFTGTLPLDVVVTNVLRHVLKIIRDEYYAEMEKKVEDGSLQDVLAEEYRDEADYCEPLVNLRTRLVDHLVEYKSEIVDGSDNIANQSLDFVRNNDVIMTYGRSRTVEKFLIAAAKKKRKFEVIVAGRADFQGGETLAKNLSAEKIRTTLIPDGSLFSAMSRVSRIILGSHSVLTDGALRTHSGVGMLAVCAKQFSVPVLVLAPIYKLTPGFDRSLNLNGSPLEFLPPHLAAQNDVVAPLFDYVPPELISIIISHVGGNGTSYVYRLVKELYHPADAHLNL